MNDFDNKTAAIAKALGAVPFCTDEPMKKHTFFRIGGNVRLYITPGSESELIKAVEICRENGVEPFIIGNGTNLLVNDGALDIIAISTRELDDITLTGENELTAGAGALLSHIAVFALENALAGMEFAHGIPGSLGGAVFMNAGAYGGEMKDIVTSTRVLGADGKVREIRGAEHEFGYRTSFAEKSGGIVLSSAIKLRPGVKADIKARMDELMAKRSASQPLNYPSAGSTFKRPVGGYAAALIDGAGLKGLTVGGAQVSEKHAGFVINAGGASFRDVRELISEIQRRVFDNSGIMLEPEVRIIGEQGAE